MWVTKLMISQVKKRIFCPKTTKFNPKLAFLVDMGQDMQVFSVPCWWVSWWLWRAGCISQDTYLLYLSQICVGQFYHTLFHHQHDHEEAFAKRRSSSFYMVVENDFLATRVLCKDNFLHTSFSSFSHHHHFIITNLKLFHHQDSGL